jgi:hypothetical protein
MYIRMHRMYYFSQVNIIAHGLLFHNQTELHVYYRKFYLCFRFNHYGSGSKKVPLQDVLSYALEFAQSKPEPHCLSLDIEMESPKPHTRFVYM